MDSVWSWEQKTLVKELTQGMELVKQLRAHLNSPSPVEAGDFLAQRILSSYERALLMLNCRGSVGAGLHSPKVGVAASVPESPLSMNGSPKSDDFDGGLKDNYQQGLYDASKKRKTMPRWTDQVRVSSENGLEGPHDDGYSWRKYGQKDILGAKHPRSYYRCTYRNTQHCWATKQVQRSDEDPAVFDITYRGVHTCSHGNQLVPPASPEKQEQKQNNNNYQQQQSQEVLLKLQKGLRVNTENLDSTQMAPPFSFPSGYGCINTIGSYSPSFISPTTPEPNYCSVSPFQTNSFGGVQKLQISESEFTEIISANTSATNSPIVDLDFSLEPVELDHNFPFDTPGFFSQL